MRIIVVSAGGFDVIVTECLLRSGAWDDELERLREPGFVLLAPPARLHNEQDIALRPGDGPHAVTLRARRGTADEQLEGRSHIASLAFPRGPQHLGDLLVRRCGLA